MRLQLLQVHPRVHAERRAEGTCGEVPVGAARARRSRTVDDRGERVGREPDHRVDVEGVRVGG